MPKHSRTLKSRAQSLRRQGKAYSEIATTLNIAKSTASLWCRDVPLSQAQRDQLFSRTGLFEGVRAAQTIFWQRRQEAFNKGLAFYGRHGRNPKFAAGLMLYWAEGTKTKHTSIANSDPHVIRFMVQWFQEFFSIGPDELAISMHIHSGQNERKMKQYWSQLTGVPLCNFRKSFVKPQGTGHRKNRLYRGTIQLVVYRKGSTYLLFTLFGCISAFIADTLGEHLDLESWVPKLKYAK